jgi:large subunit ribosomal protein L24
MSTKLKIRTGDMVEMRKGKDRGRRGKVLEVRPKDMRVVVEGLNIVRKHRRPRTAGQKGEIVALPRAVPIANVMVVCPSCNTPTRVGISRADSSRWRVCKRCGHEFK